MPEIDANDTNASMASGENTVATDKPDASDDTKRLRDVSPPTGSSRIGSSWWILAAGLGIPALVLFTRIGSSGIWDPYELTVADLARRIAINLFGAKSLVLQNAENGMPTLGDLGRGELPFTSVAAGFSVFGLREWAGRLPLALWAFAGIAALYWCFSRLVDRRAAAYVAIALATMPLYFVQARTMLGDIVTMAAMAIAFSGLSVGVFDQASSLRARIGALAMGLVGLAAGFLSRGAIIGIAVPTLSVGLTWLLLAANQPAERPSNRLGRMIALTLTVAGLTVAALGARSLFTTSSGQVSSWVGATITPPGKMPTFDFVILYLGHGLFPWSAFVPFAIGRLFRPPIADDPDAQQRALALRTALIVGSVLSFGAFAMMAPRVGYVAFAGVAFLAGIAAVAIRDYERGAPASRALGIGVVTFLALFYRDFDQWPDKGLSAFGVSATTFPETFKKPAGTLLLICALVFGLGAFAGWLEQDSPKKKVFDLNEYLSFPKTVRSAHGGNLAFILIVIESMLIGFGALVFLGLKLHWKQVLAMSANVRVIAINAWWFAPVVVLGVVYVAYLFRDVCRIVFPVLGFNRAFATLFGGAVAGSVLAFSYYPRLANQLSPKDVFDSYGRLRRSGEQLGLLGVNSRTATYYYGGDIPTFPEVEAAHRWLTESADRRWLALRIDDLGRLNSMYRSRMRSSTNLPVLDGHSGQVVLASNKLQPNERNENPFNSIVLSEKPKPSHPLDVDLQGQLIALGWDVTDLKSNTPIPFVIAGKKYRLRLYFEVTSKISGEWECFIHIDGHQRRFNGDHKPMDGKYPMSLWQVGDVVVDDYEFALEPNFTPGSYVLYYGFFVGETRLKVLRGNHHEDRIDGGLIHVQ